MDLGKGFNLRRPGLRFHMGERKDPKQYSREMQNSSCTCPLSQSDLGNRHHSTQLGLQRKNSCISSWK